MSLSLLTALRPGFTMEYRATAFESAVVIKKFPFFWTTSGRRRLPVRKAIVFAIFRNDAQTAFAASGLQDCVSHVVRGPLTAEVMFLTFML